MESLSIIKKMFYPHLTNFLHCFLPPIIEMSPHDGNRSVVLQEALFAMAPS